MKTQLKTLVISLMMAWVSGCSNNPVEAPAETSGSRFTSMENVQLLDVPMPKDTKLAKGSSSTGGLFTVSAGGILTLKVSVSITKLHLATVVSTFSLPPKALTSDQYITMGLGDSPTALDFDPEGLTFNKHGVLTYVATGLDLSSVPRGAEMKLFYVNSKTGQCEEMPAESITYNKLLGTLICLGGEIPHFSQYAFGYIKK